MITQGWLLGRDVGVDADGDGFAVNLHGGSLVAMGAGHDQGFAGRAGGGLFQGQRYDEISVNDFSFHRGILGIKCADCKARQNSMHPFCPPFSFHFHWHEQRRERQKPYDGTLSRGFARERY